jgi:hypothetical protein
MADRRQPHRRGANGRPYRRFRAAVIDSETVCQRCGEGGFVTDAPCAHPSHARMRGCPTHPRYPTLGHRVDLQHGGRARDRANAGLEHFGCNASAGARSKSQAKPHVVWDW